MSEKKLLVVPALLKAHVDQYVKKDGTVVQAHDDKRQAAKSGGDYSMNHLIGHPIYSKHVAHEDGDGSMTTPLTAGNEYSTAKALKLANPGWTADDHENLAKDHKKKVSDVWAGSHSMSPRERMKSGASALERAHQRLADGHTRAALELRSAAKSSAASKGTTLTKAHVDSYTRKDGTFVQAHDDKRQAAAPAFGRGVHHAVAAGLKDHLISGDHDTFKKVAHHLGHPEWKAAPSKSDLDGLDGQKLQEAHDHLYSGKELPQADTKPSGSPYAAARGEVMMSVGKDYKPAAKKMLDSMEAGGDHAEEFGKYHFGASHEIVKKTLQKHGIDVGGGSKPAGPKPGHMDVSTLAAGHHLFDKNGQKVDEVESVEKHPMGGLKVNTRAGYSHMVGKDGRNDHGLTNKAPGGSAKPRVLVRKP